MSGATPPETNTKSPPRPGSTTSPATSPSGWPAAQAVLVSLGLDPATNLCSLLPCRCSLRSGPDPVLLEDQHTAQSVQGFSDPLPPVGELDGVRIGRQLRLHSAEMAQGALDHWVNHEASSHRYAVDPIVHHIRGRRYLRPGLPQLQHALLVCGVPAGNKCRFGHPVRQFRVDLDPDPAGVPIRVQGWVSRATPPHAVSNAGAARGIANPTVVSSAGSPATICDLTNGHSFRHDSHATRLDLNSRVRSPPC